MFNESFSDRVEMLLVPNPGVYQRRGTVTTDDQVGVVSRTSHWTRIVCLEPDRIEHVPPLTPTEVARVVYS
jgi:hypothetical protein